MERLRSLVKIGKVKHVLNVITFFFHFLTVLPVGGLNFMKHTLEVEIDSNLPLPLLMFGTSNGQQRQFTQCHQLNFEIALSDHKIVETSAKRLQVSEISQSLQAEGACAGINVMGKVEGFTKVKVKVSIFFIHPRFITSFFRPPTPSSL